MSTFRQAFSVQAIIQLCWSRENSKHHYRLGETLRLALVEMQKLLFMAIPNDGAGLGQQNYSEMHPKLLT